MPGHIGTSIVVNSRKMQFGTEPEEMSAEEIAQARARLSAAGTRHVAGVGCRHPGAAPSSVRAQFLEEAPMTAAAAAEVILDGVKAERWRILVGDDALELDKRVREAPEEAYERTSSPTSPTPSAGRWGVE